MSLYNNAKILIGSVVQAITKKRFLGDSLDTSPIALLMTLLDSLEYAISQYNAGKTSYEPKIKYLNSQIQKLKDKCPSICIYRDRLTIIQDNTAPTINNNTIEIPLDGVTYYNLPYDEVIHEYQDAENNLISQVIILSTDSKLDLLIDNNPVITGNIYNPNINFKAHYKIPANNVPIYLNDTVDGVCKPYVIMVTQAALDSAESQGYNFVEITNPNLRYQKVIDSESTIPNNTLVYMHVDTSSMASEDITTLNGVISDWWSNFITANPEFGGSLVCNTIANSAIPGSVYAPGRDSAGIVDFTQSDSLKGSGTSVEDWLATPTQAFLRQAYKEGLNNFADEDSFLEYIKNKSLIVVSFIDETDTNYHGATSGYIGNNSTGYLSTQPTARYTRDYYNFTNRIRPRLNLFKGLCYPISRVSAADSAFMLHCISAIEATNLTSTQIDDLFGPDKVALYTTPYMTTWFYNPLQNNPYVAYPDLKSLGWEGEYSKYSPVADVITSQEFTDQLNSLLTEGTVIPITTIQSNYAVSGANFGKGISTNMTVQVRDNHPYNPLLSNIATITVKHMGECEDVPPCQSKIIDIPHGEEHSFTISDFTNDNDVAYINITGFTGTGTLYYHDYLITSGMPYTIRITKQEIEDGLLHYTPNINTHDEVTEMLHFELAYEDSYNNSTCDNIISLHKLENPNPIPIVTLPEDFQIEAGENNFGETSITANITYTGTDTLKIYWEYVLPYLGNPSSAAYLRNDDTATVNAYGLYLGDNYIRVFVQTESELLLATDVIKVTVIPGNPE